MYLPEKVSGARYASVPPPACVFVRVVAAAVEVPLTPTASPKSEELGDEPGCVDVRGEEQDVGALDVVVQHRLRRERVAVCQAAGNVMREA